MYACRPGESGDSSKASGATSIYLPSPENPADLTEPIKFDLPDDSEGEFGCSALDMLFVLDNSVSMQTHHEALSTSFPSFIQAIFENLPLGTDLHVGVTTTDVACKEPGCICQDSTIGCQSASSADSILEVYAPPGSGSNGVGGSQGRLVVIDQVSYFSVNTSEDPDGLITWFDAAAAVVGEGGCSFEMPVAAAGFVASPVNMATNEGFIRDKGAALVVFILTDEPDKSPEAVDEYASLLRSAKIGCGGDACISIAGLIPACISPSQSLWRFMESFGEPSVWGDINDPLAYVDVVEDALAVSVAAACDAVPVP